MGNYDYKDKEKLDFQKVREDKIKFLRNHGRMVLATSLNDRVTARVVWITRATGWTSTSCRGITIPSASKSEGTRRWRHA